MNIVDTGPLLKFLQADCGRHFFKGLGNNPICVPDAVNHEMMDTPLRHHQFAKVSQIWKRLPSRLVTVLPDDPTPALEARCRLVFDGATLAMVQGQSKDLGESMAILHASLQVSSGANVLLICDDGPAQSIIRREALRLARVSSQGGASLGGSLELATSIDILGWAIEAGAFVSRRDFLARYEVMSNLDEALPKNVKSTGLTKSPPWPPGAS